MMRCVFDDDKIKMTLILVAEDVVGDDYNGDNNNGRQHHSGASKDSYTSSLKQLIKL